VIDEDAHDDGPFVERPIMFISLFLCIACVTLGSACSVKLSLGRWKKGNIEVEDFF